MLLLQQPSDPPTPSMQPCFALGIEIAALTVTCSDLYDTHVEKWNETQGTNRNLGLEESALRNGCWTVELQKSGGCQLEGVWAAGEVR